MSKWRTVTLGELVEEADGMIRTGPFGSQLHASEYVNDSSGIPVVMPRDMADGRILDAGIKRVDEATAERLGAHRCVEGDLLLARRGDVGRMAFVDVDHAGCLCGTGSMRIHAPDHKVVDQVFLRYLMQGPAAKDWLSRQAVGATMPNLNEAIVGAMPVSVPSLTTQKRIAQVLMAFDELIEINQRKIDILAILARSAYGRLADCHRCPGAGGSEGRVADSATSAQWSVRTIGEVATVVRGRSYRKAELTNEGGVPFLTLKCVRPGGGFRRDGLRRYSGPYKAAQRVQQGDILVAVTDMTQERRIVAQALRVPEVDGGFAVPSLDLSILRPVDTRMRVYLYALLRYSGFAERVREYANGANVLHLSNDVILDQAIPVPVVEVLGAFDAVLGPLITDSEFLDIRNRQLLDTRNLLLPRLVTGVLDPSGVDLGMLTPIGA